MGEQALVLGNAGPSLTVIRSLAKAGFEAVDLEPTRIYRSEDAQGFPLHESDGIDLAAVDGKFMSAFVRARKPRAI